ncbi:hypothetical protein BDW66DRAFT_141273 [Aspergillus desertorum]
MLEKQASLTDPVYHPSDVMVPESFHMWFILTHKLIAGSISIWMGQVDRNLPDWWYFYFVLIVYPSSLQLLTDFLLYVPPR